jgi:hypothetical protein
MDAFFLEGHRPEHILLPVHSEKVTVVTVF